MWALDNRTPYAADRNWTRDKNGVHLWIVAVKATFDVSPSGKLSLAGEQPPPVLVPEYHGEPGASSLRWDSDLLLVKPRCEVLVDACAHAPGGRPATKVPVSLRFGSIRKDLVVHGLRVYFRGPLGITTTPPEPFVSRPIRYEWAFGGSDTTNPDPRLHRLDARNPIGRGFAARDANLIHKPAHSIEHLSGNPGKVGPAGFGPIDRSWSPRRELAGTYDAGWERTRKPLLPHDYDEHFAQSAPADQQLPAPWQGGERVELVNLTPNGVLRFDLPRLSLAFTTHFGSRRQEHAGRPVAALIEPEAGRIALIWQASLRVPSRETEYLDQTTITERGDSA